MKILIVAAFFSQLIHAQINDRPKLVVGIVVDQMRAEYLYRFQNNYSEDGFKRLMREGFNVKNMHYNYVPTYTGPGHASIYTGTTPANHGIVANDWYDRAKGKTVYCAEDEDVGLVDGLPMNFELSNFSRSPKNLLSSTITDELKLFTNNRSKVVGISLKDRGAILPAGHLADYAFWYNTGTGNFITSTYYSKKLPDWLIRFNESNITDSLLNQTWEPMLAIDKYTNSGPDKALFEKVLNGKKSSEFPYNLKKLRKRNDDFALMTEVPFGNTLLTQMAKTSILGEGLGKHKDTDFLTISYSSTDYVGHYYGIRSKELEDTYVRLDREIAELLSFLDLEVGKGMYTLFLTADHAASDYPKFLNVSKLRGDFIDIENITKSINLGLSNLFGKKNYIAHMDQTQIYLKEGAGKKKEILKAVAGILKAMDEVKGSYMPNLDYGRNLDVNRFFKNSFNSRNSGDILLQFQPGWMPIREYGTTHGTRYNGDTHVPLLWFGWNIVKGESVAKHTIDQITPSLSMLLDIPLPNASSDKPIAEIFD